ncbi:DUF3324 domain-containing protein [Enterococcus rotai]|uniref:DUF3324 domain-containing protein n=1 Tax=Enterococcus rotai TaxID=118060 RepID=UPI0035C6BFCD
MKKTNYLYVILFMGIFLFLFPNKTLAEEESSLGYVVSVVPSAKQIDPEQSFFYLQTTPGESFQITTKVKSTQKEPVTVKIYATNAVNDNGGGFEYTEDLKQLDKTLTEPITSMLKVETPTVTVGNFEEKEIKIQVNSLENSYQGIKMGALVFQLDNPNEKAAVKSEFAYRIGIITSENGDDYRDSKTLNLLEAKSAIVRGRKTILGVLQNPEPKILSKLQIKAEVKEKGSNKVIKKKEVDEYSLAPNSSSNFEIDYGTDSVKAGTYLLSIVASNEHGNWEFEKEFTISENQAKKLNEETAFKIITPMWIKILSILLLVTTGVLVVWLIVRRKKLEAQWKVKKRRKRKKRKKKEGK